MKSWFLILMITISTSLKAQNLSFLEQLAESESKSALPSILHTQSAIPANGLNIDVKHYRCYWYINPANDSIVGKVAIRFSPVSSTVKQLTLDMASNLEVISARFRGKPANTVFQGNATLRISFLSDSLVLGEEDSLVIQYKGRPIASPFGSFSRTTHAGVPIIYTLSEPYGAKDWWPCKQALSDKADSIDIIIHTLPGFKAVSNGLLIRSTLQNDIQTYYWKHRYPITTYLIAIAVTNYAHFQYKVALSSGDTLPIDNYPYPENFANWLTGMEPIKGMMTDFENMLTPYPFAKEKYAHAEFAFGGGMEHQTISFMQNTNVGLQAHELVHHWFGNMITCGSWQDIWLNEGFATYFAADQYVKAGLSTWPQEGQQWINFITTEPGGSVFCSDTTDLYRIFSGRLSYAKGAMLLRMLRWEIGDSAFFAGIKSYLTDPVLVHGFAKTSQLISHFQQASGRNLQEFFNDWFRGQGFPIFNINATAIPGGVSITLNQTSSHPSVPFYESKIPLLLKGENQSKLVVFNHQSNNQNMFFETAFAVDSVLFDPDRIYLAKSGVNFTSNSRSTPLNKVSIRHLSDRGLMQVLGLKTSCRIQLLSIEGKILSDWQTPLGEPEVELRLPGPGIYFLRITTNTHNQVFKLNNIY